MRLEILGCSGTYPTAGKPASGYLVESGADRILLDIGSGVFPALLQRGVMPDAIVITHRHPDHCIDLLSLLNHLRFDRPDLGAIPVFAPEGVAGALARFIDHGPGHAFNLVFRHIVVAPGDRIGVGGLDLSFGESVHPVPALCVRLDRGTSSLTYSGDTGPGGDLVELAGGSDALLCEATLQGPVDSDRFAGHLYASEAGGVATDAGVSRLILTHLAPRLDPSRSEAEARDTFAGEIVVAEPGLEVEL